MKDVVVVVKTLNFHPCKLRLSYYRLELADGCFYQLELVRPVNRKLVVVVVTTIKTVAVSS